MLPTHFERLGIPHRFQVDPTVLEREYLVRSRALHPDYHQLSSSAEQTASVELSASLNEAYTTLKDPFTRTEYMLRLAGAPSASDLKEMPTEFLEEMLELRMEIGGLKPDTPAVEAMEKQLSARSDQMLLEIGAILDGSPSLEQLNAARKVQNAAKYIRNLLRDLRAL